ncbi:hypothetical protein AX17_005364 [Amanita inopinata Kibby_2008]|nr:hypothetical protein AX17_005364 [Amanita inopinata Kibby_2008]
MSEQQISQTSCSENQRRDEQRRECNHSSQETSQSHQGSKHPRRSPSPQDDCNAAAILSQITPDWEVHHETHLPLHPKQCTDCAHFSKHVVETTQGGALTIFLEKQKRHWQRVLHEEMQDKLDNTYYAGLRKGDRSISELEDELERCKQRAEELSNENDMLIERVNKLSKHSRSANPSSLAYTSGEGVSTSETCTKRKWEDPSPNTRHLSTVHKAPQEGQRGRSCRRPFSGTTRSSPGISFSPPSLKEDEYTSYAVTPPPLSGNEEELE